MLGGNESFLDWKKILCLGSNSDNIAALYAIRRNVNTLTVNGDVTVTDSLTSLFTCTSKAKAEDDVVKTSLKDAHQVVTSNAWVLLSHLIVTVELVLKDARK